MDKQKKNKLHDLIGIACGVFLLVVLVWSIISANTTKTVGDTNVSKDAVTLTGSAEGRNGPIEVEIVADAEKIYQIRVVSHEETEGIGSVAVDELPVSIYENQSLSVDSIAGATITSDAIKAAVINALESGGFDPAVFQRAVEASAPVEKTDVELTCDVVVVGAGGAGLTASVLATQQGQDVILLEKMSFVGGNSLRAEGGMNAADTKVEAELGITDSTVDNFVEDTLRLGHDLADPELVRTLAENSAEAVDWLYSIDAPLPEVVATGGTTHKYLHKPEGGLPVGEYLVEKLKVQTEKLGIDVRVNTKATEILMEDGRAVGVKAEDAEHNYIIHAKSVVLTTGGFGANFDLMASYDESLRNAVTTNHSGATGDGIAMAQAVGADTVDMEQIQLHPTVIQQDGTLVSESVRSHGAIIVNTEGKRFVNDLAGRDVVSQAELKQPDGYCFIIFDQHLVDEVALTQKFIDRGFTITGDTYEELAKNMGLEGDAVQNFVDTMNTWNESVAKGEDAEFGRNNGMDADLSTAPFYAIKIAPGIHHTMGGIKINSNAEVIDTNGNVIPGLFAAGETTGGIHGGNRVGGNAVCDFIVFGRIAGQSASKYADAA
ncbi:MAG: flavocytochrome c [Oscillospiraceae bacterium]|nr:flavocytochrome c [Oscillospiraceae bacterium]